MAADALMAYAEASVAADKELATLMYENRMDMGLSQDASERLRDTQHALVAADTPDAATLDWAEVEAAMERFHAARVAGDCVHACFEERGTTVLWNQAHNFVMSNMGNVRVHLERRWGNRLIHLCTPAQRALLLRNLMVGSSVPAADQQVARDTLCVHMALDQAAFAVRLGRLHLICFGTLAGVLNEREHADLTGVVWGSERLNECLPDGLVPFRAGTAVQKLRRLVAVAETLPTVHAEVSVLLELNKMLDGLVPRLGALTSELAHAVMHAAMRGRPEAGKKNHWGELDEMLVEELIRKLALRDPFYEVP
jgi:hypothetical protein